MAQTLEHKGLKRLQQITHYKLWAFINGVGFVDIQKGKPKFRVKAKGVK